MRKVREFETVLILVFNSIYLSLGLDSQLIIEWIRVG